MVYEKRLIEGNFPCQQVGAETRRERSTGLSPAPNRLHVWWARRPLTASRAAVLASILPADVDTDVFLEELGIVKKQVVIGGQFWTITGKNRNLIESEGNAEYIPFSDKMMSALNKECTRRQVMREKLEKVSAHYPEVTDDPSYKSWMN